MNGASTRATEEDTGQQSFPILTVGSLADAPGVFLREET
jgi:hypothetical protein